MATINRIHGRAASGSFYGYSPLCIRVTDSGNAFTADTVDGTTGVITEGGYSKMVKVMQTLGSIVILGAQANGSFCAVVDGPSFNAGGDTTNTGAYGILQTLADVIGSGTVAITTSAASPALTSAGAFTLA